MDGKKTRLKLNLYPQGPSLMPSLNESLRWCSRLLAMTMGEGNQTTTNSMACATQFTPCQTRWASQARHKSVAYDRRLLRKLWSRYLPASPRWGVLSESTKGVPALITASSPPTELEARLRPALATSCGIAMAGASDKLSMA